MYIQRLPVRYSCQSYLDDTSSLSFKILLRFFPLHITHNFARLKKSSPVFLKSGNFRPNVCTIVLKSVLPCVVHSP